MTLALTPAMLEAAYEFLRVTPPFRGWKLPEADEIEFHVIGTKGRYGDYEFDTERKRHIIRISTARHGHLTTFLATMAHEMCHLRDHLLGGKCEHGSQWNRLADQVCKKLGFDRGAF